MNNQPINDLRLMFLKQIANETPEAAAALFEMRDAGEWQDKYKVSADWLDSFLRAVIENGQPRYDWISARRHVFDGADAARGRRADWISVMYAPAWIVFRGDWSDGGAKMLVSAVLSFNWTETGIFGGAATSFRVQYSTDNGANWTNIFDHTNVNGPNAGLAQVSLPNITNIAQVQVRDRIFANAPGTSTITASVSNITLTIRTADPPPIVIM